MSWGNSRVGWKPCPIKKVGTGGWLYQVHTFPYHTNSGFSLAETIHSMFLKLGVVCLRLSITCPVPDRHWPFILQVEMKRWRDARWFHVAISVWICLSYMVGQVTKGWHVDTTSKPGSSDWTFVHLMSLFGINLHLTCALRSAHQCFQSPEVHWSTQAFSA